VTDRPDIVVAIDSPTGRLVRPRAVLFDWDNTLVDSFGTIHAALVETQRTMGVEPWTFEQTKERTRQSLRDHFPRLFGARWEEAREVFYRAFEQRHLEHLRALPGAEDVLRGMAPHCLLAVVSNKTGRYLRKEAEHLGWHELFHGIVGATDCKSDKPSPEPVLKALEGSGLAPGPDIWFVGDTDIDLECARNSGCTGILVRPEPPGDGEFPTAPPVIHVREIRALRALALAG
jgi:phosphoglycolate phosphatase